MTPTPPPSHAVRPLTVGICTRDRHESLLRCVRSLRHAEDLVDRIVIVDDASVAPVEPTLRAALGGEAPEGLLVLRAEERIGLSAGRNRVAQAARTPYVLYLDDDALLLSRDSVAQAVAVMRGDASVAGVAFAQSDAEGRLYPPGAQPSPATEPSVVRSFIGFAHQVRREVLLAAGGYRELLGIMGEERELSFRLLDAGFRIVYLPGAPVAHLADPSGRDIPTYLHQTVRNDVLAGLLNEPLPVALGMLPVRLWRYFPMRRHWGGEDPGGFRRIVRAVAQSLPRVRRERRPVRWSTLRAWRDLAASPPYDGPGRAP